MTSDFDPYRSWLGIKSDERPPNHYDLLGVEPFESRAELIDQALIKRIDLLQDIASGSAHIELSQRILNEVSVARLCLLDRNNRERYELTLKKKMAGLESAEERIARLTNPPTEGKTKTDFTTPIPTALDSLDNIQFDPVDQPTPPRTFPTNRAKGTLHSRKAPGAKTILSWAILIAIVFGTLIGAYSFIAPRLKEEFARAAEIEAANKVAPIDDRLDVEQPDDLPPGEEHYQVDPNRILTQLAPPIVTDVDSANIDDERSERGDNPNPKSEPGPAEPDTRQAETKSNRKTARVIASYDATAGDPKNPKTVQSPVQQGWTPNDDPNETDINAGVVYDGRPSWKNGDKRFDDTDFRIPLNETDYQDMWSHGWRLEIVARPLAGNYAIGWGGSANSNFFQDKPLNAVVIFSTGNNSSHSVRARGSTKKVDIKKGFVKVVLEGKPESTKFKFSVFELNGNLKNIDTRNEEFTASPLFRDHISWATLRGKDRNKEASIQVRKVELSIPGRDKK